MRQVNFPRTGEMLHVVPVFKKGEKHDLCDYKPASVTAVLFEIMEHIIYNNIMHHLEDNDILFANQHGFRKNHSCESQLILTVEDLAKNLDHGDQMDMIILDFSEVPHQRLISKLQFYGIQGSTLTWIKSWLTSRSQSVVIDGECSKSVDVTLGVPQGTLLGPLIILLSINDVQDDLECTLRLFSDDTLLYHKITHHDGTLALQRDLYKLGLRADG